MPKLTINVDTEAKTLDVVLNGNKINNIYGVSIYQSYDEEEYRVSLMSSQEIDGVRTEVSYSLECEVEESASASKIKADAIDGFVPTSAQNELHKQIEKWLRNG